MSKRTLKCRDAITTGLPGGVTVDSHIETAAGNCLIGVSERAAHIVKISNRSMVRLRVMLSADCESPHLRYGGGKTTWGAEVEVTGRPAGGGSRERILRGELSCADEFVDQGIKMTVSYETIGCRGKGSTTMQLLLDAGC
jgi:hypothetical protein